ncbi:Retrovirus-related Pol polyprotein from transposon opus [Dictyocoela roeselum]|nr:Retrovirus-related Pol polyprotein from transposon opus [Dictyocoela roeselum]
MSSYPKLLEDLYEEEQYINSIVKVEEKIEMASFEYVSPQTGLRIKHHINVLNSLEQQDVWSWCKIIKEMAKICHWDEKALAEALTQIVNINIQYRIGPVETSEEFLNKLCNLKYNTSTSFKYRDQLSNIKQDDYITIKAYYKKIQETCQKLGMCNNWKEDIIQLKTLEIFYNGLNENVKLESLKNQLLDPIKILQSISMVEDAIIQKIKTEITHKRQILSTKQYKAEKDNIKTAHSQQTRKYCKFHKSRTHDTKECNALNRKRKKKYTENTKNENHNINKKNFTVSHKTENHNILIPIKIKEKNLNAMIDTGADGNYVSEDLVTNLKLEPTKMDTPLPAECANGEILNITHTTKINFKCSADKAIEYISEFYILPKNTSVIILGMAFLKENQAVIDLKNNTITLDGREYELEGKRSIRTELDDLLMNNTKIYALAECKKEISEIIKEAKLSNPEIGKIDTIEHEITLIDEEVKINTKKNYAVPVCLQKDLTRHLEELEHYGIIKKANPRFCSPAFVTRKRNGKLRILIDYRELNKITVKQGHPLLSIASYLLDLKGSCYFSNIDLNKGYYQIPIKARDIEKTGFSLLNRSYVFLRMPFGLTNAPRTFQFAMTQIFGDLNYVKIYLDDILVHSQTLEDHIKHLRTVLSRIKKHDMSINFEKSNFCQEEIRYLGLVINKNGIRANTSEISALKIRPPKTRKQLEKIIGLFNWFRPFVFNLSRKLIPLYDKLKRNNDKFTMTESDQKIVDDIINDIKRQETLFHPDINKPFNLKCDASNEGIGAILTQNKNLIGIYSKKFTKTEVNYTTCEKEALSIIMALQHSKLFYSTQKFTYTRIIKITSTMVT